MSLRRILAEEGLTASFAQLDVDPDFKRIGTLAAQMAASVLNGSVRSVGRGNLLWVEHPTEEGSFKGHAEALAFLKLKGFVQAFTSHDFRKMKSPEFPGYIILMKKPQPTGQGQTLSFRLTSESSERGI